MRTLNHPIGRFVTAALIFASAGSAFADVTWDAVKKKAQDAKSYEVDYKYDGPKGNFKFDYRAVVPGKIRTEIKDSKSDTSRIGTIIVYDADTNKDKVRYRTGGGVMSRNTTHKDVTGTPFAQPLFTMILEQVGSAKPAVVPEGGRTRFDFKTGKGKYSIWANDSGDMVKTERIDGTARETREFTTIKWNNNPDVKM